ncbi:stigma-specific STIG1-like protein 1 [Diospyros lotus]|uniref:stigma-specific STIG1-like protein 1 n=1 Tax=Diospyros lotus TaxID=55363 RepID=UPI0022589904|nr:stigma-specific STIG1-like protein 1 [Diospyros lotus]
MEPSRVLFILLALAVMATTITTAAPDFRYVHKTSRFLGETSNHRPPLMTCDKNRKVCAPGTHCCGKRCVNLMADKFNCEKCGKSCRYTDKCCQGVCVNPNVNKKHCGRCNNECEKGSSCAYGMCSYG